MPLPIRPGTPPVIPSRVPSPSMPPVVVVGAPSDIAKTINGLMVEVYPKK